MTTLVGICKSYRKKIATINPEKQRERSDVKRYLSTSGSQQLREGGKDLNLALNKQKEGAGESRRELIFTKSSPKQGATAGHVFKTRPSSSKVKVEKRPLSGSCWRGAGDDHDEEEDESNDIFKEERPRAAKGKRHRTRPKAAKGERSRSRNTALWDALWDT